MSLSDKYIALYRQYRPTRFDEIKGQDHIVKTLENIILNNKISHAYLFCGPHGNGKTSTAKVFANTINCSHKSDPLIPCDNCILNIDRNLDIIEIDAASNTGIDDIRELREKIKHLPTQSKYKIYIIDEVHMLSKGAFNALLKTLEEPPKHVIFILATTDPQKIPLTILSRVQRFNFKKMDLITLISQLKVIFEKENIEAEESAYKLIAELGNGSFRDTLSIADQVSIFSADKKITTEVIEKFFGISNPKQLLNLLSLASNHELKKVLALKEQLLNNGADIERILSQLISLIKDLIIFMKTNDESLLEVLNKEDVKSLSFSEDKLYRYLSMINEANKEIRFADIPQQLFELLLINLSELHLSNENYKHVIEIPKTDESVDFVVYDQEDKNDNKEQKSKIKQTNNEQLNSVFDLANIANSYQTQEIKQSKPIEIKEVDVDVILEKTQEILLAENDNSYQQDDITDEIITSNYDGDDDFVLNEEFKEENLNTDKSISIDKIIDCLLVRQFSKIKAVGFENSDYTKEDSIHFAMLNIKLPKSDQRLITLFSNLRIMFSSKDFILFTSEFDEKVHQLNQEAYTDDVISATKLIFGRYVHLFAITTEEFKQAKQYWSDHLSEIRKRKIEPLEDLSLRFSSKEKSAIEWAENVFGDRFKVKK
ncbi:DNA polymerase III subunit gamma/tau [Metamycoplasma spumans]|uniref:DNA polymerase III subunit gamma/tau n=1 Tax=Metamycoplasma spumans TaxID=92406 RepID=UPI0034DD2F11